MRSKGTLVVIGGPTASGKTHTAAVLAKHLGTEVISADSRQFYGAMRIGTARPLEEELRGVKHHFLGHLRIDETWSAGAFARAAETELQRILHARGIAVLLGGSGLYIDALIKGLDPLPAGNGILRTQLQERTRVEGLGSLLQQLEQLDPVTYARIDHRNPHRVIRALEVCISTGRPYSEQRSTPPDREDLHIIRIAMEVDRQSLYARIDARVDRMVADGLVEEARSLLPFREHNALRTVGYSELFEYFDGHRTLEEAIGLIKQHTRNYAKRQATWLRRDADWAYLPPDPSNVIDHVNRSR